MSKQKINKNKAHLYASGGMDIGDMALGTMQFADGLMSYKKEREANEELYNNAIDNTRIGFNGLSSINNLDDLESQLSNYNQLHEIGTSDLIGNDANRLGKYLSVSSQAASAGGASGNGFGFLAGSIVGQLGAGWMSRRNKKKAEEAVDDINQRVRDTNELYTAMADNRLNNIMQNQMSENQWNYIAALGGNLHSNSTTWSNGLNYIGSGGSHESNPNDGVAISTAPDGLQNKVEEGEVVWNDDYVFSKRLKVPKKDIEKNKWKGETYADIAKKLMDESAERPNDPITLRGLDDSLSRLRDSQDELKVKQEGNRIKKEIASMPPELLAQMQQAQQQPTEEEMMQQQAMEQPVEQMPMVDPGMQQPMMEQPPMYAKGGKLKGGPGKWIHLSDDSQYDYALNKKPIAAIFDDILQKNKNKRQPLIYKKEHITPEEQNIINEEVDYSLDDINKKYNQSNYIGFNKQKELEESLYAKGGHLFGGPWGSSLIERTGPIWEDVQEKPIGRQSGFQLNPNGTTLGSTTLDKSTAFDSIGNNIAANSNGINNHTLGVELGNGSSGGQQTNAGASNSGFNKSAMFQGIAQGINMIGAGFQSAGYKGGDLNALYKGTKHKDMFGKGMHTAMNMYKNIGLIGSDSDDGFSLFAKGGHLYSGEDEYTQWLAFNNLADTEYNRSQFDDYIRNYRFITPIVSRDFSNKGRTFQLFSDANKVKRAEKRAERQAAREERKAAREGNGIGWDSTYMRYAPVLGSIFNVARSIASKPDYNNPARIERAAARVGAQVSPKYIGDYLRYRPLDESYYLNQLNAQQNAANNAIMNMSNGNRSMALASLLANDYNYNNQRGAAYRQGLEYNEAQRQRAAEFNRGTNQFNAQQYMQAAAQNAQNRAQAANLIASAAQMREGIDNAYGASQSANWTSLFNNLGAVGKDRMNWNMAKDIYDYQTGRNGEVKYKPAAKGGYLTIKTNNRRKE